MTSDEIKFACALVRACGLDEHKVAELHIHVIHNQPIKVEAVMYVEAGAMAKVTQSFTLDGKPLPEPAPLHP